MSLHRVNPKRDATEAQLVEYLEARGALVMRLSGKNVPDLLCGYCGRWTVLECKSQKAGLTEGQAHLFQKAQQRGLPAYVVRTVEDCQIILDRLVRLTA